MFVKPSESSEPLGWVEKTETIQEKRENSSTSKREPAEVARARSASLKARENRKTEKF